jgi:acetyl-CoA carboxylase carboxyl transferase beta subunit
MTVGLRWSPAREGIAGIADAGSFEAWDDDLLGTLDRADPEYRSVLAAARERSGSTEAIRTGRLEVFGSPAAVVASDFDFLGGSVGVAVGERIARACERAVEATLPLVVMPASGGTRMQEGTLALVQMAKASAAVQRVRDAGLPVVVYLADPTTGGTLGSWAGLGSLTLAMPGAFVGFAGPRVVETLTGHALPDDVQRSERLYERGLVDAVVPVAELRERLRAIFAVAGRGRPERPERRHTVAVRERPRQRAREHDAWASLRHASHPERPSAAELLASWATDVTPLSGDALGGGDDGACIAALARVRGVPAVVVAQHRDANQHGRSAMGPAGYRKARRAIALAEELGLPLVTLVDSPGAELSEAAEEGGLAWELARTLAELQGVGVPTLGVLLGEGGSGGALALLAADRMIAAEHAYLAPIAPEAAAAILRMSAFDAPELARAHGIRSADLLKAGIVDVVVPEPEPAHRAAGDFIARLGESVEAELLALLQEDRDARVRARRLRYRSIAAEHVAHAGAAAGRCGQ